MSTKRLPVSYKGKIVNYALIDADRYEELQGYNWTLHAAGYAQRRANGKTILLHRELTGLEAGDKRQVDHINGKVMDNRSVNLRIVTAAEQRLNGTAMYTINSRKTTSRYRGVSWRTCCGKWVAKIQSNHVQFTIGLFDSEVQAAKAYDAAARALHGDLCCTNFGGQRRASLSKAEWERVAAERTAAAEEEA